MPKKTTLKTRRCWHKESLFCSQRLRKQHLCQAAQQRAQASAHLASAAPRARRPLLSTRSGARTENTVPADRSLVWRLMFKYTYIRIYVFVKRGLWVQQPRRTVSLVQRWTAPGAFHHWASSFRQPQECSDTPHRSPTPSALATHSSAQLTKNCPFSPEAPRWTAERPPAPAPDRSRTQRGLRCGQRPCGGGAGKLCCRDRFPPAAPLLAELPWEGRTGPRRSPWVAGQAPRSARVPEGPSPPPAAAGAGGGRAAPIPGQTSPPSARTGPRCRQRERRAGCLSNPSTFLHRARYVTDRGGRDNARAR